MAFDSEPKTPGTQSSCYQGQLARTISENVGVMEDFVDKVWTSDGASGSESIYSKAFTTAFDYFINSPPADKARGTIL